MSKRLLLALFAFAAVIVGCGSNSSEPDWASEFRTMMADEWTDTPADEQFQACTVMSSFSDEELEQVMSFEAGGDNAFDDMMRERGETPTVEDYELATDIAVQAARDNCPE